MFGLSKMPDHKSERYATSADFCRIFERDMNRLYLLSLLLTGDQVTAEKCFVQGLDSSKGGNPVFKEWAESWARRTIIQNAIQMIQPHPTDIVPRSTTDHDFRERPAVAAILALPAFDRFAYVLSVLEGYPLHECALLLDCSRGEVITARMRALQGVVKSVEAHRNDARSKVLAEVGRGREFSRLAATA